MSLVIRVAFKPLGKLYDFDAALFPRLVCPDAIVFPIDHSSQLIAVSSGEVPQLETQGYKEVYLSNIDPLTGCSDLFFADLCDNRTRGNVGN